MRTIGVVTVARSDYGIYLPILRRIEAEPELELRLLVSGMHLSPEFGMTIASIEADGFRAHDQIEMLVSSDTPEGIAKSMGLGTIGFAQSYARSRPDILLVLGDRFEMHSAVTASIPFQIPVAHIHGGESTEGINDQQFRHSITKMSHLHFVSTDTYRNRVIQMGEEPWRVTVSGAPALDNLISLPILDRQSLEAESGLDISASPLLVTYHPSILEPEDTRNQMEELLAALEQVGLPIVFTYPNADAEARLITQMIHDFADHYNQCQIATNLGTQAYFSLMALAKAMVGNSSSGIIEAASFGLPVVNIGNRQLGRISAENVSNVGYDRSDILQAIRYSIEPTFRSKIKGMVNPYGDGHAANVIVKRLNTVPIGLELLRKPFHDQPTEVLT